MKNTETKESSTEDDRVNEVDTGKQKIDGTFENIIAKIDANPYMQKEDSETPPPIQPSTIFDARKELRDILKASGKERRVLLKVFKERLAYQKKGIAKIQDNLVDIAYKNPDLPDGFLIEKAEEMMDKYGFTEEQRRYVGIVTRNFEIIRGYISEIKEECPDPKSLFEQIFHQIPKKDIRLVKSPVSFYFQLSTIDFLQIFEGKTDFKTLPVAVTSQTTLVTMRRGKIKEINLPFILERMDHQYKDRAKLAGKDINCHYGVITDKSNTKLHEEQHVIYKLLQIDKLIDHTYYKNKPNLLKNGNTEVDLTKINDKKYFETLLAQERQKVEEKVKNELLAFIKGGSTTFFYEHILMQNPSGCLYNFASAKLTNAIMHLHEGEFSEAMDKRMNSFREINHNIREARVAFQNLCREGYSEKQAITILTTEPLSKWPKAVKRLKEAKQTL